MERKVIKGPNMRAREKMQFSPLLSYEEGPPDL